MKGKVVRCAVYTRKSSEEGLDQSFNSLHAQREAVAKYVTQAGGVVAAEFEEVESGKRNDRPQLAAALDLCRRRRAVLVIAKLDRLARNVAFVARLMESGVEFVAVDMPQANRLTLHVLGAKAEHERKITSQLTRAALAAARARGTKLGSPRPNTAKQLPSPAPVICALRGEGRTSIT